MQWFVTASAVVSSVLAICAVIPYVLSIVRGQTKPHQFTWFIFMLMSGLTVMSQVLAGARASALLFLVFFINQLVIFIAALKYGVRGTSRFDLVLLALSLLTIILWVFTKSNALAIWMTVIIDVFATWMTLLKLRSHPSSEAMYPWLVATAATLVNCLTLIKTPLGILYVRPLYAFLSTAIIPLTIWYYHPRQTSKGLDIELHP